MTHVILGAGAVGSALAAQMTLAGLPNTLVARGAQLENLRSSGLTYVRPTGQTRVALKVSDLEGLRLGPDDILWLAVKTQDAGALIAQLSGHDLPLVTLQNGLEAERLALRHFSRLYAAVVRTPAVFTKIGTVSVLAEPAFAAVSLGRYPGGTDALSARLVADLTRAGALAEEHADIPRWKAQKLIYNVRNVVELFSGTAENLEAASNALSKEAAHVLQAAGLDPAADTERKVSLAGWQTKRDPSQPSGQSTWQSFVRGQSHEVDFLNGEIVLQARLNGLQAPWNRAAQILAARLFAARTPPATAPITSLISMARA